MNSIQNAENFDTKHVYVAKVKSSSNDQHNLIIYHTNIALVHQCSPTYLTPCSERPALNDKVKPCSCSFVSLLKVIQIKYMNSAPNAENFDTKHVYVQHIKSCSNNQHK